MPAEYIIDKSLRMVFTKAYGDVFDQEAYAHQDKLRDYFLANFDPSFSAY